MIPENPWIYLTASLGLFVLAVTASVVKEMFWPKKPLKHTTLTEEVQKKIDDQFLPITVKQVYEMHRDDLDLYIRIETEEERAIRKWGE